MTSERAVEAAWTNLRIDLSSVFHDDEKLLDHHRPLIEAAMVAATPAPREPETLLRLHVEYAIEHLTDFAKPGTVFKDVRDVLHAGLAGKPLNIGTAVGARCPVCDALTDPRGEVEPHR